MRRGPRPRPPARRTVEDNINTDVLPRMSDELLADMDRTSLNVGAPIESPANGPIGVAETVVAPDAVARPRRRTVRREREKAARRGRTIALLVTAALVGCAALAFAALKLMHWQGFAKDFGGQPGPMVIIRVHPGDTAQQIADTMVGRGVVASESRFYRAAIHNDAMSSVEPGYYQVQSHISGHRAVDELVAKDARVGNLVLSDGRQLFDSHDAHTGALKEGIYRKIAEASCYGPAGQQHCMTYDQLKAAGASNDLTALGVPDWALDAVRRVPDHQRQLEGLIAAGTWDFDPSSTPTEILHQLITASAAAYAGTGLLQPDSASHLTPYKMLIAASLVEREALPQDMAKVARVILNRLAVDQPLQFDSTVNYDLPETAVATTDADRARLTPWNTYAQPGLPATPISSPSIAAVQAVENPAPGPWLYFVTVDKQGRTLFTANYQEHLRNIKLAEESGILDNAPAAPCGSSSCPR